MITEVTKPDRETELVRKFWRNCRPVLIREIGAWAEDEIVPRTGPFKNLRYRRDRLPWTRLLFNELGKWHIHVITGPVQAGKSLHAFVMVVLYYLFEVGEDVICGLPDINMAGVKWESDIKPVILSSSYAHLLPDFGPGSKGGKPTPQITFKNGKTLTFMGGGGSDAQRAGATTKVLCITEADKLDEVSESSKEGQTKIDQLKGRTSAYDQSAVITLEGTLSTEDAFTYQAYLDGTASRIMCPCVHCDVYVCPEREHLVGWQDAPDEITAGEQSAFSCPSCGGLYSEQQRREMNERAVLVHKGQEVTTSGEVIGDPPRTRQLGFRWNGFNNLLVKMSSMGQEEWKVLYATEENREAAETAVKQKTHCLPAKNDKAEKVALTVGIVRGSAKGYAGRCSGIPRGVVTPDLDERTAFIDLGKDFLSWSIEAMSGSVVSVLDYGFHQTEMPNVIGEKRAILQALDELTLELEDRFDVAVGLIDCGNWREFVMEWLRFNPGRPWHPSHGLSNYVHPVVGQKGKRGQKRKRLPKSKEITWHWSRDGGIDVVNFDPDVYKKRVHSGYLIPPLTEEGERRPGSIMLFGEDPQQHSELGHQIIAETWVTEFVKDRPSKSAVKSFFRKSSNNNHQLDCSAGQIVARAVLADKEATKKEPIRLSDIQRRVREGRR